MATRFYLPSSGAAAVTPSIQGAWDETASEGTVLETVTTKISSAMASVTVSKGNGTTRALVRRYVSKTVAPQTIPAGTVKGQMRALESATNDNLDLIPLGIYVVSNDGTTLRGTILALGDYAAALEFATSLTNRKIADGDATSSVVCQAGDRIVIEVGIKNSSSGASVSGSLSFGDNSATDLAEDTTTTTANNPWIELSQTITFSAYVPTNDSAFALSIENVVLTQQNTLAVDDLAFASSAEEATLDDVTSGGGGGADYRVLEDGSARYLEDGTTNRELEDSSGVSEVTLVVDDVTIASTAENVSLTQQNVLVVADSTFASTAENVTLVQQNTLAVDDVAVASTAEAVSLTQQNVLAVDDSTVASTAESVALVQQNALSVDDETVGLAAENVSLVQQSALVVADVAIASTAEAVTLTQQNVLSVDDSAIASSIDNVTLSTADQLSVDDATIASTAESVSLTEQNVLAVQDSTVGLTAEQIQLTVQHLLSVDGATVALSIDSPVLTQQYVLAVQDITVASTFQSPTLSAFGASPDYDALQVTLEGTPRLEVYLWAEPFLKVQLESEPRLKTSLTAKP